MTDDYARQARHGAHLFKTARGQGWTEDSGEGPLEYLMRRCYETGHDDARREAKGER
jgi:hypothetical protein